MIGISDFKFTKIFKYDTMMKNVVSYLHCFEDFILFFRLRVF